MHLSPSQTEAVRRELASVRQAAEAAEQAGDITTALRLLMATRDRIVGAAVTLRGVDDEVRGQALRKLESVL